ncbi:MAG: polysaccharide pyruvyl transferase family protein [Bacteroidia bacterium]|nr:polysaccharide pyruvyl transferase family protein [Bacteroidia bacterium]
MNKIGLVSPHSDPNFGTMLQAYALSKVIVKLGFYAEYIRYRPTVPKSFHQKLHSYVVDPFKIIKRYKTITTNKSIDNYDYFNSEEFKITKQEFEAFRIKHIPTSSILFDPKTIGSISGYSKYIVGSDQTWSPYLYKKNTINFLEFVKDNSLKNSYAPSFGTTRIPDWYLPILKEKLKDYNLISCREEKNCKKISSLINKKVYHVLDPTLLLQQNDYQEIEIKIHIPSKFILCYILGEKDCISEYAEALGKRKNIPVYYVATRPKYLKKEKIFSNIGPGHLIYLINNAETIITDSFHGTIFSINFQKDFYSFTKRLSTSTINDNSRISDFLQLINLQDRLKDDNDRTENTDIDYSKIEKIIQVKRKESIKYLQGILKQ